jgi:branched-chain amino acid transport system ATP-binding protein
MAQINQNSQGGQTLMLEQPGEIYAGAMRTPAQEGTMPVVETHNLVKEFRGFRATNEVNLRIAQGHIHALVGPNGAGKTTLFNLLTGFLKPTSGRINIFGHETTGLEPEQIARLGVARSFQITSLFEQLTLLEHVELALQSVTNLGYRFWLPDKALARFREEAMALLEQVGLMHLHFKPAGSLPYGQKRALELALALALKPKLLLLDEPTAGMGVEDIERTIELVRRVRAGRTIVLVEHNMTVVSTLAEWVTVLQYGSILAEGTYQEVRQNPEVISAYLGGGDHHA